LPGDGYSDLAKRKKIGKAPDDYLGHEPGQTGLSRHVHTKGDEELRDGTLCYAKVQGRQGGGWDVLDLYPVMISRDLYQCAPEALLDESLRPAPDLGKLSPAERVFGWANPNGEGAFRGQLRIGPVRCEQGKSAIESFSGDGFPVNILGQPKPAQVRFYGAKDQNGTPHESGMAKKDGYKVGQGLRGRKVYPHHAELAVPEYWKKAALGRDEFVDINGKRQYFDCRRPNDERDDQNRSVGGWIKPETQFSFEIQVTNLSDVELGALLWLLSLPEKHYHRLGGGKPLGFGSVRLDIGEGLDLRDGEALRADYLSLLGESSEGRRITNTEDLEQCLQAFREALKTAYRSETPDFIEAFKRAATGFSDGLPVHYPRNEAQPNPQGEGFKWFVANENDRQGGQRLGLPSLAQGYRGLPRY